MSITVTAATGRTMADEPRETSCMSMLAVDARGEGDRCCEYSCSYFCSFSTVLRSIITIFGGDTSTGGSAPAMTNLRGGDTSGAIMINWRKGDIKDAIAWRLGDTKGSTVGAGAIGTIVATGAGASGTGASTTIGRGDTIGAIITSCLGGDTNGAGATTSVRLGDNGATRSTRAGAISVSGSGAIMTSWRRGDTIGTFPSSGAIFGTGTLAGRFIGAILLGATFI